MGKILLPKLDLMNNSPRKDFFKFALGFLAVVSVGVVMLFGVGYYQIEVLGAKNVSAVAGN